MLIKLYRMVPIVSGNSISAPAANWCVKNTLEPCNTNPMSMVVDSISSDRQEAGSELMYKSLSMPVIRRIVRDKHACKTLNEARNSVLL